MVMLVVQLAGIALLFYAFASEYFKRQKLQEEVDRLKNAKPQDEGRI